MPFIDMHCDTIMALTESKAKELYSSDLAVSLEKMKMSDTFCQFFAMFIHLEEFGGGSWEKSFEYCLKMFYKYQKELEKNRDIIAPVYSYNDIVKNQEKGLLSSLLTVEEGGIIDGKTDRINTLYDMGVRLITLTWNFENCISYPASQEKGDTLLGLKDFGKDCVEIMNQKGIIIDVSHLSDGGFYDVAEISKKPFIASHSNARTICDVKRNLTDDMLKTLANKGGMTGINFYPKFLTTNKVGKITDIIAHIKHIVNVAGIEAVGLGSDFDGFDGKCEISDISQLIKLEEALNISGFTGEQIDKICYKNTMRVLKDIM